MTTKREKLMKDLTRQFALTCGLPLPHPRAKAGDLHDKDGRKIFEWFKCPRHLTWMQPCYCHEIPHWHCAKEGCGFMKPAKFRSVTERRLFGIMKNLIENGI